MHLEGIGSVIDRIASVAMIFAAGILLWVVPTDRRSETVTPSGGSEGVETIEVTQVVDPPPQASTKGKSTARLAIIEFSDFECPFCGQYARNVYPRLVEEYVNTGKVQYVFRHYPLDIHPRAVKAAEAVECAGAEGMYWEMHDVLFEANGALAETDLLGYAAALSLSGVDFGNCLQTNLMAARVMEDQRHGEYLGVVATPTFFFAQVRDDGKLILLARLRGARPYSVFRATVEELLSSTVQVGAG